MKATQHNMLRSLVNAKTFLTEHAGQLGAIGATGIAQDLARSISELSESADEQGDLRIGIAQSFGTTATLRRSLIHEHLKPIVRIARLLLPNVPELAVVRTPRPDMSVPQLAQYARNIAKAAGRYEHVFTQAGLPADFIRRMLITAESLVDTIHTRDRSRGKVKGASTSLQVKLARGRKLVHVIDAFIQNAAAGDAKLLATWNEAKRVRKVARHSVATTTDSATPPLTLSTSNPGAPDTAAEAAA